MNEGIYNQNDANAILNGTTGAIEYANTVNTPVDTSELSAETRGQVGDFVFGMPQVIDDLKNANDNCEGGMKQMAEADNAPSGCCYFELDEIDVSTPEGVKLKEFLATKFTLQFDSNGNVILPDGLDNDIVKYFGPNGEKTYQISQRGTKGENNFSSNLLSQMNNVFTDGVAGSTGLGTKVAGSACSIASYLTALRLVAPNDKTFFDAIGFGTDDYTYYTGGGTSLNDSILATVEYKLAFKLSSEDVEGLSKPKSMQHLLFSDLTPEDALSKDDLKRKGIEFLYKSTNAGNKNMVKIKFGFSDSGGNITDADTHESIQMQDDDVIIERRAINHEDNWKHSNSGHYVVNKKIPGVKEYSICYDSYTNIETGQNGHYIANTLGDGTLDGNKNFNTYNTFERQPISYRSNTDLIGTLRTDVPFNSIIVSWNEGVN